MGDVHKLSAAMGVSSTELDPSDMTLKWYYSTSPRPTWGRLIQTLREAGLEDEARRIEQEHQI